MEVRPVGSGRYLRVLQVVVYGFKIIGLAPFTLQTKASKIIEYSRSRTCTIVEFSFSKLGMSHNLLLFIILLAVAVNDIPLIFTTSYVNKSPVTQAIDVTQGLLSISTACAITIFWAFKQNNAASIMNRLVKIDCLASRLEKEPRQGKEMLISFIIHIIVNTTFWTIYLTAGGMGAAEVLTAWMSFQIPVFVIYWFIIQYSIVVGLVSTELGRVNKILSEFNDLSNTFNGHNITLLSLSTHSQFGALQILKAIRTTISEVSRDISSFFSFPILPCIACLVVDLVYNVYYLVIPILVPSDDLPFMVHSYSVVTTLMSVYPLILLSCEVTKIQNEAKLTGWIIHKLLGPSMRQNIKAELEEFSLQLLHENISFTACGLFSLDCTLLHSILAAAATYLIIFIQFLQSSKN